MPNSPVPAAATGLPNRRLFLAAGSAGAVFSALGAAAAQTPPISPEFARLIAAHREADEIACRAIREVAAADRRFNVFKDSVVFGEEWPGDWRFNFEAPGRSRSDLLERLAADRESLGQVLGHASAPMRGKFLALWQDHEREVLSGFDALAAASEAAKKKAGCAKAEARAEALLRAEDELLLQICAWPCVSLADMHAKGEYLFSHMDDMEDERLAALMRSIAGHLPAEG